MAHMIEIRNGEASFAFNENNGDPWHRLGTPVSGYGDLDAMLFASNADYEVTFAPLYLMGADGKPIEVETHRATVRTITDLGPDGFVDTLQQLGVVGSSYTIEQNRACGEWAMEMVGAAQGDAVIDTMGVLRDGAEFFVCIDLGTLVLDPDGVRDVVKRYFVATNRHDGTSALRGFATDTRVVCNNTLSMALSGARKAQGVYSIRHTSGKDDLKRAAVEAYGMARQIHKVWAQQMSDLFDTPANITTLSKVVDELWPKAKDETDRQRRNRMERKGTILGLYNTPTNAENFGDNGWTVYNTVGEYLDHHRPRSDEKSRALASADQANPVNQLKRKAAELLLAGV